MTAAVPSADLVLVGSGGGAMTAALVAAHHGLRPLLLEKTESYGGSTALSGGGMWIPNNYLLALEGVEDSLEAARSYMAATVGDRVPRERQEAFLLNAPRMVEFLRDHSRVAFSRLRDYSDYYPERPGGCPQGRGIEAQPLDARELGPELARMRQREYLRRAEGFSMTAAEYRRLAMLVPTWQGKVTLLKVIARLIRNRLLGTETLTMGRALAGRLRLSLADAGIPLRLGCSLVELLVEGGRVVGLIAEEQGGRLEIRAARGVVLAAGGFEHNATMRSAYQQAPITTGWTMGNPGNTGDAIRVGLAVGAAVDLMEDAWWGPSSLTDEGPIFHVGERSYPGSIMVDGTGLRFVNESAPYVDVVHAMYARHSPETPCIPAYFLVDQRWRRRYPFGMLLPWQRVPEHEIETGRIKVARSLPELAAKIGADPARLVLTVERFNEFARTGKDLDFGRGESAYDRYYSDPTHGPNPCLAPLAKPPFYAAELWPGDLGTKGGLVTDEHARVLRGGGSVIEGLYAIGNASASVMGNTYPGPGATIGPAMTFGYVAARHAAGAG